MSHRQYHISTVYIQTDTVSIRFGKHEHLLDKVRIPGQWRIRELFCIFGLWGMKKYWKILLPKRIWTIIVAVVIIYDSSQRWWNIIRRSKMNLLWKSDWSFVCKSLICGFSFVNHNMPSYLELNLFLFSFITKIIRVTYLEYYPFPSLIRLNKFDII